MAYRALVVEAIRTGVHNACADIVTFTEGWSRILPAEYLLTVDVARAISGLNSPPRGGIGFPFKIYIEERTREFVRKCIPLWPVIPSREHRSRIFRAIERKGKIDIAVTHDSARGPVPVCVIEVKGFGADRKLILKDLIRNANFMAVAGLTGEPRLEFTAFVGLHKGKASQAASKETDLRDVKKKYQKLIETVDLPARVSGVNVDCEVFTVSSQLVPDSISAIELEYPEDMHHFIGAIITFYREG